MFERSVTLSIQPRHRIFRQLPEITHRVYLDIGTSLMPRPRTADQASAFFTGISHLTSFISCYISETFVISHQLLAEIEGEPRHGGKVVLGLFGGIAPRTVENFRALCACDRGNGKLSDRPLCYKGTKFHRISELHVMDTWRQSAKLSVPFASTIYIYTSCSNLFSQKCDGSRTHFLLLLIFVHPPKSTSTKFLGSGRGYNAWRWNRRGIHIRWLFRGRNERGEAQQAITAVDGKSWQEGYQWVAILHQHRQSVVAGQQGCGFRDCFGGRKSNPLDGKAGNVQRHSDEKDHHC